MKKARDLLIKAFVVAAVALCSSELNEQRAFGQTTHDGEPQPEISEAYDEVQNETAQEVETDQVSQQETSETEAFHGEAAVKSEEEVVSVKIAEAREALKKGEIERAISLLNEALSANHGNAEIYFFRGFALASQENFAAAAPDFEKAIELDPANAQNHYYAGMVYGRLRMTDLMVFHYRKFLELAPNALEAPMVQSFLRSVS
jgi:tetratricopeptide (TPR) repeat protein